MIPMQNAKVQEKIKHMLYTLAFPFVAWIIMEVLCLIFQDRHVFNSILDIQNYARNVGISVCTALALSYNLGNGRFDMSLGAQRMMSAIIGGNLAISLGFGTAGVIVFAVVIGIIGGAFVGILFVTTRIPPMVLGIGMALVYECMAFAGSNSQGLQLYGVPQVAGLSSMYLAIGVVVAAVLFVMVLDRYTKFGFYNRAISGSQKIAHNCGINIFTHAVGCYTIGGGLVAFSGLFDAGFKGVMGAELGFSSNSSVMTNCFPMFLGKFIARWSSEAVGILFATMSIRLFQLGLSVLKFSSTAQQVFTSALFLIFLIVRANEFIFKQRRAKSQRIAQAIEKRAGLANLAQA